MKIDIENLKKKILYRSQYRGTREMDKLLSSFVSRYIDKMDEINLLNLEKFLENDDEDLYKFYNGMINNLKYEDDFIIKLFKNFNYK
tara:strand:- start:48 stop:308 length:261 start_codon:yes stop_codon:yes gene_type:complete